MPQEPNRTTRIEARIAPDALAVVKRAAEIQGRSVSDFVVAAAQEAAHRAIEETQIIRLSVEDQRMFAAAILNPHRRTTPCAAPQRLQGPGEGVAVTGSITIEPLGRTARSQRVFMRRRGARSLFPGTGDAGRKTARQQLLRRRRGERRRRRLLHVRRDKPSHGGAHAGGDETAASVSADAGRLDRPPCRRRPLCRKAHRVGADHGCRAFAPREAIRRYSRSSSTPRTKPRSRSISISDSGASRAARCRSFCL